MKTAKALGRFGRRILSILMSLVMVATAMPLSAIEASAAGPAEYAALGNALKAYALNPVSWNHTANSNAPWGGAGTNYLSSTSSANEALFDVLDAYYTIVYDNALVGTTYANLITDAPGNNFGYAYALPMSANWRLLQELIAGGYLTGVSPAGMTAIEGLLGNGEIFADGRPVVNNVWDFTIQPGKVGGAFAGNGQLTNMKRHNVRSTQNCQKDTCDDPVNTAHTAPYPVSHQLTTGNMGVQATRTAMDAFAQANYTATNLESEPNDLVIGMKINWPVNLVCWFASPNTTCNHADGQCPLNSDFFWMNSAKPQRDPNTTANVEAWRDLLIDYREATMMNHGASVMTKADVYAMTYPELVALEAALTALVVDVPAAFGARTDGILSHYGLPPITTFTNNQLLPWVRDLIAAYAELPLYADYFQYPPDGKIPNAPTSIFDTDPLVGTYPDPRDRNGYGLNDEFSGITELSALYAEASPKHEFLKGIHDNNPVKWADLVGAAGIKGYVLDIVEQADWIENLRWTIWLWDAYEMRDRIDQLLDDSANPHGGANPNDLGGTWTAMYNAWNADHPADPDGPFGNSQYIILDEFLQLYRDDIQGFRDWVGATNAAYGAAYGGVSTIIDAVINADPTRWYRVETVRDQELADEIAYRYGETWSESVWYSYRNYFTPMLANPTVLNGYSAQGLMAMLRTGQTPHPNAPNPPYNEYLANRTAYYQRRDEAVAALGTRYGDFATYAQTLWMEIYRDYDMYVIMPIEERILDVMAAKVTADVETLMLRAMKDNPAT
ncbi:MAG: hypothetical protein LBB75_00395, partial [Oscillospiraceae bacterium]|nr:hypothetical protein [Oscillospiraceae bacterium]